MDVLEWHYLAGTIKIIACITFVTILIIRILDKPKAMSQREQFEKKWSIWFALEPEPDILRDAFKRELDELIEKEVEILEIYQQELIDEITNLQPDNI